MTLPEGPRVTLDELATDLVLVGLREDAPKRRRAVDRLARERLPRELGRALEGSLGSGDAVIRIRRLELELDVKGDDLRAGTLAAAWSRRLARVLREELRKGPGPNLAIFESHADFMAAYVESLVTGTSPHPWAFQDFEALGHLEPADAVVEVLAARPAALVAVARRMVRGRRLDRLVRLLGEPRCRRLLEAAAGTDAEAPARAPLVELLRRPEVYGFGHAGSFAHGLALVLGALADGAGAGRVPARARAGLALARARTAVEGWSGETRDQVRSVLAGRDEAVGRRDWSPNVQAVLACREVGVDGAVGAFLFPGEAHASSMPEPAEAEGDPGEAASGAREDASPQESEPEIDQEDGGATSTFRTPFAGLALVVPVLRALELPDHLGLVRIRRLLVALAGSDEGLGLAEDPFLDVLASLEDEEDLPSAAPPWPSPKKSHLLGLRSSRREQVENAAGPEAWAELVGAHLAARLHRLEESSLGYLRAQFLTRSGTVTVDAEQVRVVLDSVPLSVVLRMSGMLGERGRIPWAGGRRLIVTLAGR